MIWFLLGVAVLAEVTASLSLRTASQGQPRWYVAVVLGYASAFVLLAIALREGLNLGVAYGIWTASGVALTALISHYLFNDPLTRLMLVGIGLIMTGVVLIETGAHSG